MDESPAERARAVKSSRRRPLAVLVAILCVLGGGCGAAYSTIVRMPGTSHVGALAPLTAEEMKVRDDLRRDLRHLAVDIGERNLTRKPEKLEEAEQWIARELAACGYDVKRHPYEVEGRTVANLSVIRKGTSDDLVIRFSLTPKQASVVPAVGRGEAHYRASHVHA